MNLCRLEAPSGDHSRASSSSPPSSSFVAMHALELLAPGSVAFIGEVALEVLLLLHKAAHVPSLSVRYKPGIGACNCCNLVGLC